MLAEMRIRGLGVIDDAALELHPGLTVLTGETGAGKTMVVTGLSLLGGARADASRVSEGVDRATVEGRFVPVAAASQIAEELGAEADEDGSLIAVRSVGADGRSRAHVGGRAVPIGVLSRLSEVQLVVHGQNDQLRLLRPAEQCALLDRFAGDEVDGPLRSYRTVREQWRRIVAELTRRRDDARQLAREADVLQHGLAEIAAVAPQPAEDTELTAQARRLAAADDLRAAATAARDGLAGSVDDTAGDAGALGLLAAARRNLTGTDDADLDVLAQRLAEPAAVLADAAAELTAYLESLDADPDRLAAVLARQADLKQLTRRYAADVDGVLVWAEQAQQRLVELDTSDEALAALDKRRVELADELAGHAARLSAVRQDAAQRLAGAVTAELAGLAMPDARLRAVVARREATADAENALNVAGSWLLTGPDGVDEVELRLAAHTGAAELSLHRSASGGELSRVMLALEVVLAGADPVPTMVFDEVDAGVGGRAAVEVGRRLAQLAASHQVIVVTHLPQVAAYADRHLVVDKAGGRSTVRTVAENERIVELARMLAGLDDTDTGRAHAEELLATARNDKHEHRASPTQRKAG